MTASFAALAVAQSRHRPFPDQCDCVPSYVSPHEADEIWVRTANLGPYKASTVLDLAAGAQMEMRYLFEVPLERARYMLCVL